MHIPRFADLLTATIIVSAFAPFISGCGQPGSSAPMEYVAADSDFTDFRDWVSFPITTENQLSNVVYPIGPKVAFLSARPPAGSTTYPIGTRIVKVVQRGPTPPEWEIFGLAKRGNNYNAAGDVNWEFFLLDIGQDDVAHIASRGLSPGDDGHPADMGPAAGYWTNGMIINCNICHGMQGLTANDHILAPELYPSVTALVAP